MAVVIDVVEYNECAVSNVRIADEFIERAYVSISAVADRAIARMTLYPDIKDRVNCRDEFMRLRLGASLIRTYSYEKFLGCSLNARYMARAHKQFGLTLARYWEARERSVDGKFSIRSQKRALVVAFGAFLRDRYMSFRFYLPLVVNIDAALFEAFPFVPRAVIRAALHEHVNSMKYLTNRICMLPRVSLDMSSTVAFTSSDHTDAVNRYVDECNTLRARIGNDALCELANAAISNAELSRHVLQTYYGRVKGSSDV